MPDIFSLCKPQNAATAPVIFDSPHSGTAYPADFNYSCDEKMLKACEDQMVDQLFASAPAQGCPLLLAHIPRSYIDLNRAIDDIDSKLLDKPWQGKARPTERSAAGIGLIRRLITQGKPVYNRALSQAEIQNRIDSYYIPYYAQLEKLYAESYAQFGSVLHINCHSMPAHTAIPSQPIGLNGQKPKAADFVLGDLGGTSCNPALTRKIKNFLEDMGYAVTINDPFKGVELIQRFSDPGKGKYAIQLEINKALYMNENTFEKNNNFQTLQANIEKLIAFMAELLPPRETV